MLPLARPESDELLVTVVAPETIIFDLKTRRAHCLNPAATLIWRRCDGETSIEALAQALHDDLSLDPDTATVWVALESLQRLGLLQQCPPPPPGFSASLRRRLRRRLIVAMGTALISSIIAPLASAAASCLPKDATCTLDTQCCSHKCTGSNKCQ